MGREIIDAGKNHQVSSLSTGHLGLGIFGILASKKKKSPDNTSLKGVSLVVELSQTYAKGCSGPA